jgi:MarR family transcriptional regulator, organic hydroperoxide resistance regulator
LDSNYLTSNQRPGILVPVIDEPGPARTGPDPAERPGQPGRAGAPDAACSAEDPALPVDASLWELLATATRTMAAYWAHTAQGAGVSPAGLNVLRMLARQDGLMSSEVAARGWSTPGSVTSVVDTLVRDGLVERRRDDEDRRVVRLYLTGEGRRKLDEARTILAPKWKDAFDYVAPGDEAAVRKFLADTIERFGLLIRKERGT